jgi:uncharacterized protein
VRRAFADTHFYLALLNERDPVHAATRAFLAPGGVEQFVTTGWVLLELANAMSRSRLRARCHDFIRRLQGSEQNRIISLSDALQSRGLDLFGERPDKAWSLTDCISFVVMADEGLTEALTGDRHFEQAGYRALLA